MAQGRVPSPIFSRYIGSQRVDRQQHRRIHLFHVRIHGNDRIFSRRSDSSFLQIIRKNCTDKSTHKDTGTEITATWYAKQFPYLQMGTPD